MGGKVEQGEARGNKGRQGGTRGGNGRQWEQANSLISLPCYRVVALQLVHEKWFFRSQRECPPQYVTGVTAQTSGDFLG